MPIKPPHTKAERQAVVGTEMHKFGQGTLHSGSKSGPVVTSRPQAIAIGLSEAGLSRKQSHGFKGHKPGGHSAGHRVGQRSK